MAHRLETVKTGHQTSDIVPDERNETEKGE